MSVIELFQSAVLFNGPFLGVVEPSYFHTLLVAKLTDVPVPPDVYPKSYKFEPNVEYTAFVTLVNEYGETGDVGDVVSVL